MESFIRDPGWLDTLLVEVLCGWHRLAKFFEHLRKDLLRTSDPKPIVFPGFIVIIPTGDDLTEKTLEIVGIVTVWGVLHSVLCSKLLHYKVGEAIKPIEDPKYYHKLRHVRVQL